MSFRSVPGQNTRLHTKLFVESEGYSHWQKSQGTVAWLCTSSPFHRTSCHREVAYRMLPTLHGDRNCGGEEDNHVTASPWQQKNAKLNSFGHYLAVHDTTVANIVGSTTMTTENIARQKYVRNDLWELDVYGSSLVNKNEYSSAMPNVHLFSFFSGRDCSPLTLTY